MPTLIQKNRLTYNSWRGMRNRCSGIKHNRKHIYADRGITVCERWNNSFADFLKDMGPRPSKEHSIDRFPDNNGNYEPGNCRWATDKQQMGNSRRNKRYEFNGKNLMPCEWDVHCGFSDGLVRHRLRAGWTIQRAVTTPADAAQYYRDLSGIKIGTYTAKKLSGRENHKMLWECVCDCGDKQLFRGDVFARGLAAKCKTCSPPEQPMLESHWRFKSLCGFEAHSFTVTSVAERRGRHIYWKAKCKCGFTKTARSDLIRNKQIAKCPQCSSGNVSA